MDNATFRVKLQELIAKTKKQVQESYGFFDMITYPRVNNTQTFHTPDSSCVRDAQGGTLVQNSIDLPGNNTFCMRCADTIRLDAFRIKKNFEDLFTFSIGVGYSNKPSAAWRLVMLTKLKVLAVMERTEFREFPRSVRADFALFYSSIRALIAEFLYALADTADTPQVNARATSKKVVVIDAVLWTDCGPESVNEIHSLFSTLFPYCALSYRGVHVLEIPPELVSMVDSRLTYCGYLTEETPSLEDIDTLIRFTEDGMSFTDALYTALSVR